MNARSLTTLIALSFTGLAGAQCVKTPTHAFNGLVRITYPSGTAPCSSRPATPGPSS